MTEDSIEIEVKWDSGNDGGGHLYMEIGILIMVSLYYNCKICNQTCQSQLTIFVHDIILVDGNTWIDESILMDNCWKIENLSLICTTDVMNLYWIFEQGVKNQEATRK